MINKKYSIDTVIEQAKERTQKLLWEQEEKLLMYPKGSLTVRVVGGKKYCYFRYRDGKKVVTKYAGTESKLNDLKKLVVEREKLVEEIKEIQAEMDRIKRIELIK